MKGLHVLVSAALVILISLSVIGIIFSYMMPVIERNKEQMIFKEAKNSMMEINKAISSVVYEGEGSSRTLSLSITGGEYYFNSTDSSLNFYMETKQQILAEGVNKIENNINITSYVGKIEMRIEYSNIKFLNDIRFGKGDRRIKIKNVGFDPVESKTIVSISES